eukprot:8890057-Heterocapsa_arctica.AAC.1
MRSACHCNVRADAEASCQSAAAASSDGVKELADALTKRLSQTTTQGATPLAIIVPKRQRTILDKVTD